MAIQSPYPAESPASSIADRSDIKGVVASPIYKQHFRLEDGSCVEDDSVSLRTWPVRFDGEKVVIEA
ncbi:nitrite reductase (NAD(P)H) small subunit [Franzmannia qiaohouensis]|uniref:nitrite reductase (NAD(P)H) small subunit n=1 Tax=Franzmannia qiaohouensis TaxID=1329370 RepID=UPI003BEF2204